MDRTELGETFQREHIPLTMAKLPIPRAEDAFLHYQPHSSTSDNEYNIYTTPVSDQDKCVKVELTASGCRAPSSSQAPQTSTQKQIETQQQTKTAIQKQTETATQVQSKTATATQQQAQTQQDTKTAGTSCPVPSTIYVTVVATPAPTPEKSTEAPKPSASKSKAPQPTTSGGKTCPADLSGNYQYPHLIAPVDSSNKDKAYGTSYNGTITSTVSSIFNFDIPTSYAGTCFLVFLFPTQDKLETSSYTFSGNGEVDFKQLKNVASQSTTYANQGAVATDFGVKTVTPGSNTVVSTFACPAGEAVSYELSAIGLVTRFKKVSADIFTSNVSFQLLPFWSPVNGIHIQP
ncbi:ubiquitin 3 binding protein But2 C-terminal domain-containing protein [Halenospora varia]|nr:ubiquitin 3 binding protein But2 C-terminal domain-containing protein [Halenospora varia]